MITIEIDVTGFEQRKSKKGKVYFMIEAWADLGNKYPERFRFYSERAIEKGRYQLPLRLLVGRYLDLEIRTDSDNLISL